jgi:hypothetical protein
MRFISTATLSMFGVLAATAAMAGSGVDGGTTIPEPSTIALFAAGAAGVLLLRRRLDKRKD